MQAKAEKSSVFVRGLRRQRQPTPVTCVQTCLAMALGQPVRKVVEVFGEAPMNQLTLGVALTQCRLLWNQLVFGTLAFEGWYFAAVPSLNTPGGMHEILLHYSPDSGVAVVDPAIGRTYAEDGSDLKSWSDLTVFLPGGALPERVA